MLTPGTGAREATPSFADDASVSGSAAFDGVVARTRAPARQREEDRGEGGRRRSESSSVVRYYVLRRDATRARQPDLARTGRDAATRATGPRGDAPEARASSARADDADRMLRCEEMGACAERPRARSRGASSVVASVSNRGERTDRPARFCSSARESENPARGARCTRVRSPWGPHAEIVRPRSPRPRSPRRRGKEARPRPRRTSPTRRRRRKQSRSPRRRTSRRTRRLRWTPIRRAATPTPKATRCVDRSLAHRYPSRVGDARRAPQMASSRARSGCDPPARPPSSRPRVCSQSARPSSIISSPRDRLARALTIDPRDLPSIHRRPRRARPCDEAAARATPSARRGIPRRNPVRPARRPNLSLLVPCRAAFVRGIPNVARSIEPRLASSPPRLDRAFRESNRASRATIRGEVPPPRPRA